jgi:hypothetical protein
MNTRLAPAQVGIGDELAYSQSKMLDMVCSAIFGTRIENWAGGCSFRTASAHWSRGDRRSSCCRGINSRSRPSFPRISRFQPSWRQLLPQYLLRMKPMVGNWHTSRGIALPVAIAMAGAAKSRSGGRCCPPHSGINSAQWRILAESAANAYLNICCKRNQWSKIDILGRG